MAVSDTKMAKYSDERLIQEFRKKQHGGHVYEMFRRYIHLVYGNCVKYLKNETLSIEATNAVLNKLPLLMQEEPTEPFSDRLYQFVKEHCQTQVKAMGKPELMSGSGDNDIDSLDIEESERLEREVASLNRVERQCIELHMLEGKSLKEVSEITGYPIDEVKRQVEKGRENLKNRMGSNE